MSLIPFREGLNFRNLKKKKKSAQTGTSRPFGREGTFRSSNKRSLKHCLPAGKKRVLPLREADKKGWKTITRDFSILDQITQDRKSQWQRQFVGGGGIKLAGSSCKQRALKEGKGEKTEKALSGRERDGLIP